MDKRTPDRGVRQWLWLRAAGAFVRVAEVFADPELTMLAIDDLCLEIAEADWAARKPRCWQRRRLMRWRAEHAGWCVERDRLRSRARNCGPTAK
jgi:hypothetical protein